MVPLSIIHRSDTKPTARARRCSTNTAHTGLPRGTSGRRGSPGSRRAASTPWRTRGSGVYGEDWYKAEYKTTKPAPEGPDPCAEYLIAQRYTSSSRLGILGGSGRHPRRPRDDGALDLFAAVVPDVGLLDAVRAETTTNGVQNHLEFGTVKKEDEFRALPR
jgi:hypothetical protein